jgi:hypothetical protein
VTNLLDGRDVQERTLRVRRADELILGQLPSSPRHVFHTYFNRQDEVLVRPERSPEGGHGIIDENDYGEAYATHCANHMRSLQRHDS